MIVVCEKSLEKFDSLKKMIRIICSEIYKAAAISQDLL